MEAVRYTLLVVSMVLAMQWEFHDFFSLGTKFLSLLQCPPSTTLHAERGKPCTCYMHDAEIICPPPPKPYIRVLSHVVFGSVFNKLLLLVWVGVKAVNQILMQTVGPSALL